MADAKPVKRKNKKEEGDKQEPKTEEKKESKADTSSKESTTKSSPTIKQKNAKGGGVHPCLIFVGVLMLVCTTYLIWFNLSDNSGEVEGSYEGGRLASSLKTWPGRVLNHQSAGVYVPINDGKLSYNIFARSEGNSRKENEVVLLLHGVPVSSYVYRNMLPHLQEAGLYAVAFDFPGLGLSDKPKGIPYNWHYLAERVKDIIDAMDLGAVHLVLHDIAGPIGLEFAIKYPMLVRSITFGNSIINPEGFHPAFPMSTFLMDYVKHVTFWLTSTNLPLLSHLGAMMFRKNGASTITHEDYVAHTFLLKYNRGKESFLRIMEGMDTSAEHAKFLLDGLKDLIEEKNVSAQAVWVTDDVMSRSQEFKELLTSRFNLKHVHTLESKHFVQEDQPEAFAKHIISFVKEQGATPSKVRNKKMREAQEKYYQGLSHGDDHGHSHGHEGLGVADLSSHSMGMDSHHGHGHHGHHGHGHAGCSHH